MSKPSTRALLSNACLLQLTQLQQNNFKTIALVLGDQLNASHSWFNDRAAERLFVLMEIRQETDYCRHHIQKIVGFFAAMRRFASALARAGHNVLYLSLDNGDNRQTLTDNLAAIISASQATVVQLQQPDEYRLDQQLQDWCRTTKAKVEWFDSEHFITQRSVLQDWFGDQDNYVMEHFYRRVRKQTGYLMTDGKPAGGKWNFDHDNRKTPNAGHDYPKPLTFAHDVSAIHEMLVAQQVQTIGEIDVHRFIWPLGRREAQQMLSDFVQRLLPAFGDYQDAMVTQQWSLYHSRLSFALNTKMLSPRHVVETAIAAWHARPEEISLNQIEGFVRQIIGWREFVRAIYWQLMPSYGQRNHFNHHRELPDFYWTGATKMNCLAQSIRQSLDYAYAHHIQRLMVTGNFALLAGCDPDAVDAWYLGIYIDAIEWVELPNTRGMSQYADGGVLATKPYVSSGSYIAKMSNYCGDCHYDVKRKTGDGACPFNLLYWHFIDRHFAQLQGNGRMGLILKQWDKREASEKQQIVREAEAFLDHL
ncbi:cryptochrome/photolyase family protein [Pseudidiomarina homiensis]|uniref:Cryptochrome/photolyase family protein n=1 Tax=Pseudidiomarina homiensis TaxID=364198 RepID=A0A432Y2P1_9GAMM|nr:cryptochrome/photolyase family protein [Pseudidiomarina homiensis]RUO55229.1 cryptochrome/photolyase family protein [Pseudidiomarina homiensis]